MPDVVGSPDLSFHLLQNLMDDGFDLTVFQELDVDHGFTVPLSVWTPDPGDAWPCPVVPLLVNVIQYPQPTAARCYALGKHWQGDRVVRGCADRRHPRHRRDVAPAGGRRAGGFINPEFDAMFLDAIENDPPEKLAALSREDFIRQAGSEGIELIMWLVMRGAMNEQIRKVHSAYHVPASNTAAGLALFDNRTAQPA